MYQFFIGTCVYSYNNMEISTPPIYYYDRQIVKLVFFIVGYQNDYRKINYCAI